MVRAVRPTVYAVAVPPTSTASFTPFTVLLMALRTKPISCATGLDCSEASGDLSVSPMELGRIADKLNKDCSRFIFRLEFVFRHISTCKSIHHAGKVLREHKSLSCSAFFNFNQHVATRSFRPAYSNIFAQLLQFPFLSGDDNGTVTHDSHLLPINGSIIQSFFIMLPR